MGKLAVITFHPYHVPAPFGRVLARLLGEGWTSAPSAASAPPGQWLHVDFVHEGSPESCASIPRDRVVQGVAALEERFLQQPAQHAIAIRTTLLWKDTTRSVHLSSERRGTQCSIVAACDGPRPVLASLTYEPVRWGWYVRRLLPAIVGSGIAIRGMECFETF